MERVVRPNAARGSHGASLAAWSRHPLLDRWFDHGSAIGSLEGDRPPGAPDPLREAGAVQLAQRFTEVALPHVEVAQQILHRAARRHLGEALIYLPSLLRLDIQSCGIH
jgi:hypothetical protein